MDPTSILGYWALVLGTFPEHPLAPRPHILGLLGWKDLKKTGGGELELEDLILEVLRMMRARLVAWRPSVPLVYWVAVLVNQIFGIPETSVQLS